MSASTQRVEVLIAEADPWTSNLLQQLVLKVCGDARVLQFSDGQAALVRCKRRLPDLVIADGELPGPDGLELLRQLWRHPRIRWRLPFGLRELIAVLYGLGSGVFLREALVLNLTGLLLALPNNELPASLAEARSVRMLRLDLGLLARVPVELYQAS